MNTLNKALDILEVITQAGNGKALRLADIARLAGKNKVSVRRVVSVFVERGYLSQPQKRGAYSVGPRMMTVPSDLQEDKWVASIANKYLLKLNELIKEIVILVKWDGKEAYFLQEFATQFPVSPLRIVPAKSSITPLYCTSAGKIFLSTLSEKDLDEYLKNTRLEALTPNTITNATLLKSHFMMVAQEGVAYDDEELFVGVRNVGAGIRNSQGKVVYAISVTAPAARLPRSRMTEIAGDVKRSALEISKELGYIPI